MAEGMHQLGKYRIVEELGAGGFATVFKAVDTTLDREVALKILHPPLLADRRFVHNFRQEAKTLAALRHPHIITIYEVGEFDGRIFIAMELARGASLARAIASRQRIPWLETLALLKPVCEALDYAHEQNIVHRDLKPANILIDKQRGALLTDFGFAKLLAENAASMSMSGGIVGTPGYIAPEVWENNAADAPVDIYALGCIAYEMLTGDVLFKGQTPMQAMRAHDRGPQFPETWPEDTPAGIADVLRIALAREPAERYAGPLALWHALSDLEVQARAAHAAAEQAEAAEQEAARRAEEAQRATVAIQWHAEAEQALVENNLTAAKMAIGRWRAVAPNDPAIGEIQARLERLAAPPRSQTRPAPAAAQSAAQERVLAARSEQTGRRSQVAPAVWTLPKSIFGVGSKIAAGVGGLAIVVLLVVLLVTSRKPSGNTGSAATVAPGSVATIAPAPTAAPITGDQKLEIFGWWTSGSDADSLNAMFDIYKKQNPGVEIVNATVAGGAGVNARAVLQTRLAAGQPPDSWQVHAGREALSYMGQLEPLTSFFKEQGLDKMMPKLLLDQLTIKGEIYTVPVNIHRSNMLWYNPKIFEDNNLQAPKTLDEFFTAAETFKARGITPLAVGGNNGFEAAHLFESVLLATFGPDDYTKLWSGDATAWTDERVATAINTMSKMLGYANEDRSALGWDGAAQQVLDGKAAMTIMGDWAEGYFKSKGAKPNEDFGWVAAPGTDGVFMWISDSFGLAKGGPHPKQALAWLKVCGSREGQDAFNPKKGSIPARIDADKSLYDEYLQSSIEQFSKDKLVPSIVHGAAAPQEYVSDFLYELNTFSIDMDKQALSQYLQAAANKWLVK